MSICINRLNLCFHVNLPTGTTEALSTAERREWSAHMPSQPDAFHEESLQKALRLR